MTNFNIVDDSDDERPDTLVYPPQPPPAPGAPLPYAMPTTPAPAPARRVHVPAYPEIGAGAGALRVMAVALFVIGVLRCLVAVIGAANVMNGPTVGFGVSSGALAAGVIVDGIVSAGFIFGAAVVLRMLAAVGEAVRDAARNSFRR